MLQANSFSAGQRAVDISNPCMPKEAVHYIPDTNEKTKPRL